MIYLCDILSYASDNGMIATKKPSLLFLFLLISFPPLSAVLFTPALPEIGNYFQITDNVAQLTVSVFLIGYTFGQLLYGPLANRYGRKIALYLGILLEMISALVCALSATLENFWLLVVARFFMALGASVGLKMTFTLIADAYPPEEATKTIAHLLVAFAITPGLGIALGGFLTTYLHWQSCFYFMVIYGLMLLYLSYHLSETISMRDKQALNIRYIFKKYSYEFKNSTLMLSALLMGCGTSFIYVFTTIAPFLTSEVMNINPTQYGLWNLLPCVGGIIGSQLTVQLSKTVSNIKAIGLGLSLILIGTLLMLIAFINNMILPIGLFSPMVIIYIGISLVYTNSTATALFFAHDKANGSALMSFVNMGIVTLGVLMIGQFSIQSALLLPLYFCVVLLLEVILFIALIKLSTRSYDF